MGICKQEILSGISDGYCAARVQLSNPASDFRLVLPIFRSELFLEHEFLDRDNVAGDDADENWDRKPGREAAEENGGAGQYQDHADINGIAGKAKWAIGHEPIGNPTRPDRGLTMLEQAIGPNRQQNSALNGISPSHTARA